MYIVKPSYKYNTRNATALLKIYMRTKMLSIYMLIKLHLSFKRNTALTLLYVRSYINV